MKQKLEIFKIISDEGYTVEWHCVDINKLAQTVPLARRGICYIVQNNKLTTWQIDNSTIEYYEKSELFNSNNIQIEKISKEEFIKAQEKFQQEINSHIFN